MKTLKVNRLLPMLFLLAGWIGVNAQSTIESEVPGDNFSLEGALELFKKSASPEEFEKLLNSSDSKVNNLDLNNDGQIDYVKVIDRNEGNVHAFILQAVLSETESQDVAVIELEKLADGKAVLQITGDSDVYGVETIIEPTEEVRVNAGYTTDRAVVNVWTWPSVQYVYSPYYTMWVSPWTWAYHPFWWRPWVPVAYYTYYPWWRPYRPYYSLCYSHRIYFGGYRSYRMTSSIYYSNYRHQIHNYRTRNDYAHSGRDRYHGGNSGGRNRFEGYDRSHDRNRDFGHRYEGRSGGRNGRGNDDVGHRYEANSNNGRNYNRANERGRNNSSYEIVGKSRDNQRSTDRYSGSRSNESRSQRSSTFEQRSAPQRSSGEYRSPRQSSPSIRHGGGGQTQRSAPSVGGGRSNSGGRSSMPSGGHSGSRGNSSSHVGGHSGGSHSSGSHGSGGGHRRP